MSFNTDIKTWKADSSTAFPTRRYWSLVTGTDKYVEFVTNGTHVCAWIGIVSVGLAEALCLVDIADEDRTYFLMTYPEWARRN